MADVAPLFSGLSTNNIGYVAIINRAITDPRYAETQRRTTVKDIQAKVKTTAELKKDLDAAVKAQKANPYALGSLFWPFLFGIFSFRYFAVSAFIWIAPRVPLFSKASS